MAKQNYTSTSTLPHFINTPLWEPIYANLFEIIFNYSELTEKESQLLSEQFVFIKKNKIKFNLNLDEHDNIVPLNVIKKILLKKGNVEINLHHKTGEVYTKIYIGGFMFTKICADFFDFSYIETELKDLKVKFTYDSYKLIGNKDIDMFTLNKKIKKIKCTSSDSQS